MYRSEDRDKHTLSFVVEGWNCAILFICFLFQLNFHQTLLSRRLRHELQTACMALFLNSIEKLRRRLYEAAISLRLTGSFHKLLWWQGPDILARTLEAPQNTLDNVGTFTWICFKRSFRSLCNTRGTVVKSFKETSASWSNHHFSYKYSMISHEIFPPLCLYSIVLLHFITRFSWNADWKLCFHCFKGPLRWFVKYNSYHCFAIPARKSCTFFAISSSELQLFLSQA